MKERYSPDILNCLANLSSDEVFTSPELANRMLDLLPQELFRSPKTRFLDPCAKSGVFLREIAKRLLAGLEAEIPDLQQRIDHIMTRQVFGIACTDLTAEMSRRTLYCSKLANGEYSVSTAFHDGHGNLLYERCHHTWNAQGRCKYCGASKGEYLRSDSRETYAYPFIHKSIKEIFHKDMQFDVIIGNPPYQMSDGGGTGDSAKPIYNQFIEQAKKITPRYLIMITPSRWMKGGKGLDDFRETMRNDTHIRYIYDYEDASHCFPGLHIDGGVSYFLWDANYKGEVDYTYRSLDGGEYRSKRYLKVDYSDTIIRDPRQISIIKRVKQKSNADFSKIVSPRNPFGFFADLFNDPDKYSEIELFDHNIQNGCKVYGVKGKKGGAKRVCGYVKRNSISKNPGWVDSYKLFFSKAYMTTSTVPPEIIKGEPGDVCTETFLNIGPFKEQKERDNCLCYIKTKFFRALLFFNRHSLNISQDSFSSIPLQDFSHPWTDEMLYKKYGLTEDEIAFIESMIRPME